MKVKKFIYLSSVGVYGVNQSVNPLGIDSSVRPISPYAKAKLMSENYLLNKKCDTKVTVLRLPLVYGKNSPGNIGTLEKLANLNIPLLS